MQTKEEMRNRSQPGLLEECGKAMKARLGLPMPKHDERLNESEDSER
jgi:hypothetical protein